MAEHDESSRELDVLELLGATELVEVGKNPPVQIRTALRRGLPYSALEAIQEQLELSPKQVTAILGIPERTLARRKHDQQLTPAESDRLYRVARTVAHAESVLGSIDKARAWLARPNRALSDEPPLGLLDTDIGARQVEDVLFRIEYGVHS